MNGNRVLGATAGGLLAGLGITALLLVGERRSGRPSELIELERASAHRLGLPARPSYAPASTSEQLITQGGHLLLSGLAGAAYAAVTEEDANPVVSGIGFGLVFYAAMHWITGPILGVKAPEWRAGGKVIGMHTLNHVLFGLLAAAGAKLAARR